MTPPGVLAQIPRGKYHRFLISPRLGRTPSLRFSHRDKTISVPPWLRGQSLAVSMPNELSRREFQQYIQGRRKPSGDPAIPGMESEKPDAEYPRPCGAACR